MTAKERKLMQELEQMKLMFGNLKAQQGGGSGGDTSEKDARNCKAPRDACGEARSNGE